MSRQAQAKRVERLETQSAPTEGLGAIVIVPATKDVVKHRDYSKVKGAFADIMKGPSAGLQVKQEDDETYEEFGARVDRIVEFGDEGEHEGTASIEDGEGENQCA